MYNNYYVNSKDEIIARVFQVTVWLNGVHYYQPWMRHFFIFFSLFIFSLPEDQTAVVHNWVPE